MHHPFNKNPFKNTSGADSSGSKQYTGSEKIENAEEAHLKNQEDLEQKSVLYNPKTGERYQLDHDHGQILSPEKALRVKIQSDPKISYFSQFSSATYVRLGVIALVIISLFVACSEFSSSSEPMVSVSLDDLDILNPRPIEKQSKRENQRSRVDALFCRGGSKAFYCK